MLAEDRISDRPAFFARGAGFKSGRETMNRLIWLVGAIVIVIAILGFLGLR